MRNETKYGISFEESIVCSDVRFSKEETNCLPNRISIDPACVRAAIPCYELKPHIYTFDECDK